MPHSALSVHCLHSLSMQGPPPQSWVWGELQQAPLVHWLPQHSSPEPQSESAEQPEHAPSLQAWPAGQSVLTQQVPVEQRPAQQSEPSPHSLSIRQSRQPSAPHTCPGAQSDTSHVFAGVPPSGSGAVRVHPATSTTSSGATPIQRRRFMRTSCGDNGAPPHRQGHMDGAAAGSHTAPRGAPGWLTA